MKNLLLVLCLINFTATINAQICVGTPGQVQWECWRNLFDDEIGELTSVDNYPLKPDVSQTIYKLQSPINFDNRMGGRIAGYLSVPVSDTVVFNITGDDKSRFYLSDSDNPDNIVLTAYSNAWTSTEDHTKYAEQTSDSIFLQAGIFYYFEIIYVEYSGGDHVSI